MGIRGSSRVAASGDARVDALLSGVKWAGGAVSYSGPGSSSAYGTGYAGDLDGDGRVAPRDGFAHLSAAQLAAVRAALDCDGGGLAGRQGFSVEGFTALSVSYVGGTGSTGDVRVANCADTPTAYAYLPGGGEMGGDIWLGGAGTAPRAGSYHGLTVMHEIGHALGLKHSHEKGGFGALSSAWDSLEFTVMTYRPWEGGPTTGYRFESWGAPQTYMMLDIAALQHMYGADFSVNAGNTVYSWTPGSGRTLVNGDVAIDPGGNRIFATIWDGGGKDTYDLSAYSSDLRINLGPGRHSVFSEGQLADLGGGPNGGNARGNIFNALQYEGDRRSLIENASGGSGDDVIYGNAAANRLVGGAGDDRLRGLGGKDVLIGGKGEDVFVFSSVSESSYGACDAIMSGGASAFQRPGAGTCDRMDLRGIDADTTRAGDHAFVFGTSHGKGRLWVEDADGITYVHGNIDGDSTVEFRLAIHDGTIRPSSYTADDFLL